MQPRSTAPDPVVLDTNVVSYLFKGDTRARFYAGQLVGRLPVVSFVTKAELELWAETARWGARNRRRLASFLGNYTIHYPDARQCRLWAALVAECYQAGRPTSKRRSST